MINEQKLLFIDTETGGVNPSYHKLLSVGLIVWLNGRIVDQIELLVNEEKFRVTKKALQINRIDLSEHKTKALTSSQAYIEMEAFIQKHFSGEKITLAGHNVMFDVNFLKRFLKNNKQKYSTYFSHRIIDTSSILNFLFLSKVLDTRIVSSDKAFDYFNIAIPKSKRHTALGDAMATAKLFNKLIELTNNHFQKIHSTITNSKPRRVNRNRNFSKLNSQINLKGLENNI